MAATEKRALAVSGAISNHIDPLFVSTRLPEDSNIVTQKATASVNHVLIRCAIPIEDPRGGF